MDSQNSIQRHSSSSIQCPKGIKHTLAKGTRSRQTIALLSAVREGLLQPAKLLRRTSCNEHLHALLSTFKLVHDPQPLVLRWLPAARRSKRFRLLRAERAAAVRWCAEATFILRCIAERNRRSGPQAVCREDLCRSLAIRKCKKEKLPCCEARSAAKIHFG